MTVNDQMVRAALLEAKQAVERAYELSNRSGEWKKLSNISSDLQNLLMDRPRN